MRSRPAVLLEMSTYGIPLWQFCLATFGGDFFVCNLWFAFNLVRGDGAYGACNSGAVYQHQGANFCIQRNHIGINYNATQPELLCIVATSQCADQDGGGQCRAAIS